MLSRAAVVAFAFACALGAGDGAHAQSRGDFGFTTAVSPTLVSRLAQKFKATATELLGRWLDFAKAQKSNSFIRRLDSAPGREADVLQLVNDYLNRVPYKTDQDHWGQADYWATPAESIASNGGDCEDYSIAKYYLLKELGVPLQRLRITYVKAVVLNQAHMVLAYYSRPDAEPLILDNIENLVKPASQRSDLVPVYSFNDDELQIVSSGVRGKPSQIRAWLSVQERLRAESGT